MPRGQAVCTQYSGVYGCPCTSQLGAFAPARTEGPCLLLPFNGFQGRKARVPQAGWPSLHMVSFFQVYSKRHPGSLHFCLSFRAVPAACLTLTSSHPISDSHTAFQLHFGDLTYSKANFKPSSFLGDTAKGWEWGGGGGLSFPYLPCTVSRGKMGDLGLGRHSRGEEAGKEFLLKSFIPARESHPGHIQSQCAANPSH